MTTIYVGYGADIVLVYPPDAPESPSFGITTDAEDYESDAGSRLQKTLGGLANAQRTHSFSFHSRADFDLFMDFLSTKAYGRWGRFWMPSWADDFQVIGGDMFGVDIKWCGFTANVWPSYAHRRIVHHRFGDELDWWGRTITGSTDNLDGTERLAALLDFPYNLGFANLPSAQGHRTMYLHMCRLESDDVDVRQIGREEFEVTLSVMTIPEES